MQEEKLYFTQDMKELGKHHFTKLNEMYEFRKPRMIIWCNNPSENGLYAKVTPHRSPFGLTGEHGNGQGRIQAVITLIQRLI